MPYGYLGQNTPNQTVANSGVFSITDVAELQSQGKLGGSLELIAQETISSGSQIIFTDIKETKFDVHFLEIINFQPSTDARDVEIRFYESGVEESASVYQYAYQYGTSTGTFDENKSTGNTHIRGTINVGNATNEGGNSYCYFYNLGNSSKYSFQTMHCSMINDSGQFLMVFGGGVLPQASTVDQIKLYVSSGTCDLTAKLYGVKQI